MLAAFLALNSCHSLYAYSLNSSPLNGSKKLFVKRFLIAFFSSTSTDLYNRLKSLIENITPGEERSNFTIGPLNMKFSII